MKILRRIATAFLMLTVIASLTAEWWTPARYEQQFRNDPDQPPSARFPLGTDALGRDRLSRLMYGTRVSLLLAPAAALLSCIAAAVLGGAAGLWGGWLDRAIISAASLFLSLPWFFLLLMVRACLPLNVAPMTSAAITFLLLGLLGWAGPTQVVRAGVSKLRNSDFMVQARALGIPPARLLTRQLLPNVMPVLLAQFWIAIPVYILTETTLGMLGLGVAEPMPSWGGLLKELEGANAFSQFWLFAPAILLAAVVGSLQLLFKQEDYTL